MATTTAFFSVIVIVGVYLFYAYLTFKD